MVGPKHGTDARDDALGTPVGFGIGVPAELEVDAPDVVGLTMQEHRLVGMEGRVEPEPALGREWSLHPHIGDQESIAEDLTLRLQSEHRANGAARAVGRDQIVALERIVPVRSAHGDRNPLRPRRGGDHPATPAQVHPARAQQPLDQKPLQIILLQVDEGGALVAGLRQQVELVELAIAKEQLPDVPDDALVHGALPNPQPVEDLQRALGEADGAAPLGGFVVFVQQHGLDAMLSEVDRHAQADRTRSDDRHAIAAGLAGDELRRLAIGEGLCVHGPCSGVDHIINSLRSSGNGRRGMRAGSPAWACKTPPVALRWT